jgi:hypothetical protein
MPLALMGPVAEEMICTSITSGLIGVRRYSSRSKRRERFEFGHIQHCGPARYGTLNKRVVRAMCLIPGRAPASRPQFQNGLFDVLFEPILNCVDVGRPVRMATITDLNSTSPRYLLRWFNGCHGGG